MAGKQTLQQSGINAQAAIAERRPLTILFCDIVGSTQLADRLAPEDLQSILDTFQDVCTDVCDQLGGYIADRPGDGVLVYFGYPRALEDDAECALRCAQELQRLMPAAENRPGVSMQIRVGVASGRIVTANMRRKRIQRGAGIVWRTLIAKQIVVTAGIARVKPAASWA